MGIWFVGRKKSNQNCYRYGNYTIRITYLVRRTEDLHIYVKLTEEKKIEVVTQNMDVSMILPPSPS